MTDSAIDEAIRSSVGTRWIKTAMVIAKGARALYGKLPHGDHAYEQISERIENLVRAGLLIARGDTKNWRFSEIRRPT